MGMFDFSGLVVLLKGQIEVFISGKKIFLPGALLQAGISTHSYCSGVNNICGCKSDRKPLVQNALIPDEFTLSVSMHYFSKRKWFFCTCCSTSEKTTLCSVVRHPESLIYFYWWGLCSWEDGGLGLNTLWFLTMIQVRASDLVSLTALNPKQTEWCRTKLLLCKTTSSQVLINLLRIKNVYGGEGVAQMSWKQTCFHFHFREFDFGVWHVCVFRVES